MAPSPAVHTPPDPQAWLVACLCAEWCGTCRDYRQAFDELARRTPDAWFRWIDVEDESGLVEDIDIETFPTLLIQHGNEVLFFGPMPPHVGVLERQLRELRKAASPRPVAAVDLRARLVAAAQ